MAVWFSRVQDKETVCEADHITQNAGRQWCAGAVLSSTSPQRHLQCAGAVLSSSKKRHPTVRWFSLEFEPQSHLRAQCIRSQRGLQLAHQRALRLEREGRDAATVHFTFSWHQLRDGFRCHASFVASTEEQGPRNYAGGVLPSKPTFRKETSPRFANPDRSWTVLDRVRDGSGGHEAEARHRCHGR